MKRFEARAKYAGWTREELLERLLDIEGRAEIFWAPDLRLTPQEEQLLGILFQAETKMSSERVVRALYIGDEEPLYPLIVMRTVMVRVRKKLAKFGISIQSRQWGGYWIDVAAKEELRKWQIS